MESKTQGDSEKYGLIWDNIKPIKDKIRNRFQGEHNLYHLILINKKIQCFENHIVQFRSSKLQTDHGQKEVYSEDSTTKIGFQKQLQNPQLNYYECFERVEEFASINYKKLSRDSYILNKKLENCINDCSSKNRTNADFQECAHGENGCFKKYQKLIINLYIGMYSIILNKSKNK